MAEFFRSRLALMLGLTSAAGVSMLALAVYPHPIVLRALDGGLAASAVLLVALYAPGIFSRPHARVDPVFCLKLGILIGWSTAGAVACYRLAAAFFWGVPPRIPPDNLFRWATIVLGIIATILHIGVANPATIERNLWRALWALLIGAVLAGTVQALC